MSNRRYTDKNLSIVVQGAINQKNTKECLLSCKRFFPNAELILSTWHNEYTDCLVYDKIIHNDDPGKNIVGSEGIRNLNRHITSSLNGILAASRDIVIKLRSDTIFLHNHILFYMGLWRYRIDKFKLFRERILATNLYTLRSTDRCCYITDFVYCGLREDLIKLFSIPHLINKDTDYGYGPEQYIATGYFHKKYGNHIISPDESDTIIGNNFVILDGQRQAGIFCLKYPHYQDNWHHTMMSHFEWQQLYYRVITE